jgi:rhamnogalacturonyl hydrolase YesR
VVAALVRVLSLIPENEVHRAEYVADYKAFMEALVPIQRPDGFWNVSLHDPNNFGGRETSGTALFVYGMAWGINNGFLDAKIYRPVVEKAWKAMLAEAVHPSGFLGYLQGTGKEPKDGQPVSFSSQPDFEDYGLGCFLLGGTEVYKMLSR